MQTDRDKFAKDGKQAHELKKYFEKSRVPGDECSVTIKPLDENLKWVFVTMSVKSIESVISKGEVHEVIL